nr:uncharacterized protein LOC132764974 [Anolis sagrei ordinatus]
MAGPAVALLTRSEAALLLATQKQEREAVQSLHTLNDQISDFVVDKAKVLSEDEGQAFLPDEKDTLQNSMSLMRDLLTDAQAKILRMMEGNQQLALRMDCALQAAGQEVSALRAELSATSRRLAEISTTTSTTNASPPLETGSSNPDMADNQGQTQAQAQQQPSLQGKANNGTPPEEREEGGIGPSIILIECHLLMSKPTQKNGDRGLHWASISID